MMLPSKLSAKGKSDEIKYILERMPINFGTYTVILVVFILVVMFSLGWSIKYPDVLRGLATINSSSSPVKLVVNSTGRIELLTHSNKEVYAGQYLAVIRNATNVQDIIKLKGILISINIRKITYEKTRHSFPDNLQLGELNTSYFAFLTALYKLLDYYKEQPLLEEQRSLSGTLKSQEQLLNQTRQLYSKEEEKLSYNKKMFERDSILFEGKVITKAEFETANVNLILGQQQRKAIQKDIISGERDVQEAKSKIKQLSIGKNDKESELTIDLINSFNNLNDFIRQWEHKYALIAPINGKLQSLGFWNTNDFLEAGKEIFAVIPEERAPMVQVQLPEIGAGKVKVGQDVIIKLDDYPYMQYGSIKGRVASISSITSEQLNQNNQKVNNYLITVSLPQGLKTNYGIKLKFHFQAKGIADIITRDERFIERFFDNLRHDTM